MASRVLSKTITTTHLEDDAGVHAKRSTLKVARDTPSEPNLHLVAGAVSDQNALDVDLTKTVKGGVMPWFVQ